jgi:hypothetical protein
MDSNLRTYKESLNEGFFTLTRDRDVKVPEQLIEQVLPHILDSYILPRVEESFTRTSEIQNAATLRLIQEAIGQATEKILSQVANTGRSERDLGSWSNYSPSNIDQMESRLAKRLKTQVGTQSSPSIPPFKDSQLSNETPGNRRKVMGNFVPRKTKEWSCRTFIPAVGTFRIQYGSQLGNGGRFWTIDIDFWPSLTFLLGHCISLRYNNSYDPQGYTALSPSIAMYPIISDDHPIWDMISNGDLEGVRVQLQDHQNGLHDQRSDGSSLLMYACWKGSIEVAHFLLSQGADPTRTPM